jgi:hypothetical protein
MTSAGGGRGGYSEIDANDYARGAATNPRTIAQACPMPAADLRGAYSHALKSVAVGSGCSSTTLVAARPCNDAVVKVIEVSDPSCPIGMVGYRPCLT